MKKRLLACILCTTMIFSLTLVGCGKDVATDNGETPSPNSTVTPKAENVTLKAALKGEISDELKAKFEADNPNIKVDLLTASGSKLIAMMAAGNSPDLIRLSGVYELPGLVNKGMILDLDKYFANSQAFPADDMLLITDIYKFDGKNVGQGPRYGFPKDWSNDASIIINKKVFENAGVPVPTDDKPITFEQMRADAIKISNKDIKNGVSQLQGFGGWATEGGGTVDYASFLHQCAQLNVKVFSDDFGKTLFNTPEVKKVLQYWLDFYSGNGCLSATSKFAPDAGNLTKDTLGMMNHGYWYTAVIRGDEKLKTRQSDFIMLPTPVMEGGERIMGCLGATGGAIFKNTKHPDEAFKFFEYVYGNNEPAKARAKDGWGVPAFKSMMDLMPNATDFDKQTLKVIKEDLNYFKPITVNPYINDANTVLNKYLIPVLFGKDTLDGACEKLDKEFEQMILDSKEVAGE